MRLGVDKFDGWQSRRRDFQQRQIRIIIDAINGSRQYAIVSQTDLDISLQFAGLGQNVAVRVDDGPQRDPSIAVQNFDGRLSNLFNDLREQSNKLIGVGGISRRRPGSAGASTRFFAALAGCGFFLGFRFAFCVGLVVSFAVAVLIGLGSRGVRFRFVR